MLDWNSAERLLSVTHLDGRNAQKLSPLRAYFSEYAWMKSRLTVMARYTLRVAPFLGTSLTSSEKKQLLAVAQNFPLQDAQKVVALEKALNHDLKALETYFRGALPKRLAGKVGQLVNFGLGSEDINNIALSQNLLASREEVLVPAIQKIIASLMALAQKEASTLMVARTHGVPAGLTTFGKELANPLLRLCDELAILRTISLPAKLSGEVGTFHALARVPKAKDWMRFGGAFIAGFGLTPFHGATQIVPYDGIVRLLQSYGRVNSILLDLCRNSWLYVLLGYLKVQKKEGEVGSAGMPHKVNPQYFEGAEGGFVMANGIIETLGRSLPINRLQRDFSDSTIRRNIVLPLAYSLLSYQSVVEAFGRVGVNRPALAEDIGKHAEVWIEPIKAILGASEKRDAYEQLKILTRGRTFTPDALLLVLEDVPMKKETRRFVTTLVQTHKPDNPFPKRIVAEAIVKARRALR
jgi:adenylosuccinate lyase